MQTKINVPVGTGSKLCICFLHGKVATAFHKDFIQNIFSPFSSFSKSSKLVKVLPTYNESSSGTDSSMAAMLMKTEEATDSWTESKKKREDPLVAIGLLKIAAPQVLMTYCVGVPTDARCFGR